MAELETSVIALVYMEMGHEITKSVGVTFENSGIINTRLETKLWHLCCKEQLWKTEAVLNLKYLLMI